MLARPAIQPHEPDYGHTSNIKLISFFTGTAPRGEQELSDWLGTGYWEILNISYVIASPDHDVLCFVMLKRKGS